MYYSARDRQEEREAGMWRIIFLSGAAASFLVLAAHSQGIDTETIARAATTRSLCLSGSQYDLQVNADGSLSLLRMEPAGTGKIRITQNTGTSGALNYQDEGRRVEADKNIIGCISQNLPVLLTAAGARLAVTAPVKVCRTRENGVERYTREFDVSRSSPEMGGGHNQSEWCNNLIGSLRGEHPSGEFAATASSESSRSGCAPFNCPLYTYQCTVHVKSDPIYKEAASSSCP
jgi:hypothetical protein